MWPGQDLLQRPPGLTDRNAIDWFETIAAQVLHQTALMIAGEAYGITEIESYYHGPGHLDPFAHCDPVQLENGRFYFHKTRGTYRSGSFKGVDFTFGDGKAYGGFLIRGLRKPDGELIDGPSLLVDHVLDKTGFETVSNLDAAIAKRLIWDAKSPLYFAAHQFEIESDFVRCARVGLTLKKAEAGSTMPQYIVRPYRFLTEPRRIAKGKTQTILGLHLSGFSQDDIQERTGSPGKTIANNITEYEAGYAAGDAAEYFGKELATKDLCRLHGIMTRENDQLA